MSEPQTLLALHQNIAKALSSIGQVWVCGEISSMRTVKGHTYLELVEKDENNNTVASLNATILATQTRLIRHRIFSNPGFELKVGVPVKVQGTLSNFAARGSMSLKIEDIDPKWTLGQIVVDRDALLRKLSEEKLLDKQQRHSIVKTPLNIALITSQGSAAEADFLDELDKSKIGFQVVTVDTLVQGVNAPEKIIEAMVKVSKLEWKPDVVVLIRGGGSKTDLAAYDNEKLARAIAHAPMPIITGIGHEIDRSVADEVALKSYKTPTAVANALVKQISNHHQELQKNLVQALHQTQSKLNWAEQNLLNQAQLLNRAVVRTLESKEKQLLNNQEQLDRQTRNHLHKSEEKLKTLNTETQRVKNQLWDKHENFLTNASMLIEAANIQRTLERGFSITRVNGKIVKDNKLVTGTEIETTTMEGAFKSEVK